MNAWPPKIGSRYTRFLSILSAACRKYHIRVNVSTSDDLDLDGATWKGVETSRLSAAGMTVDRVKWRRCSEHVLMRKRQIDSLEVTGKVAKIVSLWYFALWEPRRGGDWKEISIGFHHSRRHVLYSRIIWPKWNRKYNGKIFIHFVIDRISSGPMAHDWKPC
jgi:hypothetical protein